VIADDAEIADSALGDGVHVGAGARIERSAVLAGARIGAGCVVSDSIVGLGASVGDDTRLAGGAMLGAAVAVGAGNVLEHGIRIFPSTVIGDDAIRF
jgi:mannose-1-phosphate guanylyltransferase